MPIYICFDLAHSDGKKFIYAAWGYYRLKETSEENTHKLSTYAGRLHTALKLCSTAMCLDASRN